MNWSCRFISIDPLAEKWDFYSPYNYAGNKPMGSSDKNGMEGDNDKSQQADNIDSGGGGSDTDGGEEGDGEITLADIQEARLILHKIENDVYLSISNPKTNVDMRNAPSTWVSDVDHPDLGRPKRVKTSKTSPAKAPRNHAWYWNQVMKQAPEMFDAENTALIKQGDAPVVNEQWVKHNPRHKPHMRAKLVHHHMNRAFEATALPQPMHAGKGSAGFNKFLHYSHQALDAMKAEIKAGVPLKTNPRVKVPASLLPKWSSGLKATSKGLLVLGIALSAYTIATAENKAHAVAEEVGAWIGGIVVGAIVGSRAGLWGALIGGIAGAFFGREMTKAMIEGAEYQKKHYGDRFQDDAIGGNTHFYFGPKW